MLFAVLFVCLFLLLKMCVCVLARRHTFGSGGGTDGSCAHGVYYRKKRITSERHVPFLPPVPTALVRACVRMCVCV